MVPICSPYFRPDPRTAGSSILFSSSIRLRNLDWVGAFTSKRIIQLVESIGERRLRLRSRRIVDTLVNALASSDLYMTTGEGKEKQAASLVGASDLLVVGPGVLGGLVGQSWLRGHNGCKVVGQTNTTSRHAELLSTGIIPVTKGTQTGDKYPFVVFSAPPSGSEDYVAEVRAAAQRWNGEGSLIFTSSSAVYDVTDNGLCDEVTLDSWSRNFFLADLQEDLKSSPVIAKGKSSRTDRLLDAEEEIMKVGGNVVRLAGLYSQSLSFIKIYTRDRGAHTYWLQKGTVDARPDHYLNLIHYEDAADLCVTILTKKTRGQVFMGCDNTPVSRQDIMETLLQSCKYEGEFQGFTKSDGPLGKRMNNNATREKLGWQPKYGSFAAYLASL